MDISNKQLLYKILCARDKRYDGRFYCGVHTTGIYCRPICPARPKIENVSFYRSAAEAEKAGFRPCLRCRPDIAPNSVQWSGTGALVGRALTMISRGDADEIPLQEFAEKLGVSDRHLRRLFEEHVGASPNEVAASKRLHLAKQLLAQSSLPVTEVAFAAGFKSIRRFNEAFKDKFKNSPASVRRSLAGAKDQDPNFIRVDLPVIAPYDWNHIYEFLQSHRVEGVENFVDGRYRRSFTIDKAMGAVEIEFDAKKEQLSAKVSISDSAHLRSAIERVRDLFDTRLNPHAHRKDLAKDDPVAACYLGTLGLRIPGAWDSFETAVCIILGQLISVEQARLKVGKLVDKFGAEVSNPVFADCPRLFPTPQVLAEVSLKDIGLTKVREQAIQELSRLVVGKQIDLSRSADIETTKARLLEIKGIGPWTVEMIAMRCLGDTNAFPKTDLIVQRALEHHDNKKGDWSPWNAYITLALWKKYAATLSRKKAKALITKS
jgi:AraC family transcriptional regulator of adaptative response / DNA-3-methyladenine glycosylase II